MASVYLKCQTQKVSANKWWISRQTINEWLHYRNIHVCRIAFTIFYYQSKLAITLFLHPAVKTFRDWIVCVRVWCGPYFSPHQCSIASVCVWSRWLCKGPSPSISLMWKGAAHGSQRGAPGRVRNTLIIRSPLPPLSGHFCHPSATIGGLLDRHVTEAGISPQCEYNKYMPQHSVYVLGDFWISQWLPSMWMASGGCQKVWFHLFVSLIKINFYITFWPVFLYKWELS